MGERAPIPRPRLKSLVSIAIGPVSLVLLECQSFGAAPIQLFGELGGGTTSQTLAINEIRKGFGIQLGAVIANDWEGSISLRTYSETLGEIAKSRDLLLALNARYRAPFLPAFAFLGLKLGRLSQTQTFTYDATLTPTVGGEPESSKVETVKDKTSNANVFLAPEFGLEHSFGFLPKVAFSLSFDLPIYLRNGVSGFFNSYFAVRYTL